MWGKKLLPKISQISETSIYRVIRLCRDAVGEMPIYCKWHQVDCLKKKTFFEKVFNGKKYLLCSQEVGSFLWHS